MVPAPWIVRLERGVLAGNLDRPQIGDEVVVASESVMVVQYPKQVRCGCVPASLGIGKDWVRVIRLCRAHGVAVHAPPANFRIKTTSFPRAV